MVTARVWVEAADRGEIRNAQARQSTWAARASEVSPVGKRRLAERLVERREARPGAGQGHEIAPPGRSRRTRARQPKVTEAQLHHSVAQLLDWLLLPPALYTTFPAGWGKFSKAMAGQLKHSGLKPGMPDILVFYDGACVGLELKAPGRKASDVQLEMSEKLQAAGVRVFVCDSAELVLSVLLELGIPMRRITTQCLDGNFTQPDYRNELPVKICARLEQKGTASNGTETL